MGGLATYLKILGIGKFMDQEDRRGSVGQVIPPNETQLQTKRNYALL